MRETIYLAAGIPTFLWGALVILGVLRNAPRIIRIIVKRAPEYEVQTPMSFTVLAVAFSVLAFGFGLLFGGGMMIVGVTWFDVKLRVLGLYSTFGECPFVALVLYPLGVGSFCLFQLLAAYLWWDVDNKAARAWTILMYYLMGVAIVNIIVQDAQPLFCLNAWLLGAVIGALITASRPENWIAAAK
ncbi:MAG: hypothetical protein GY832_05810 [Chloroflexi bacterium]|nr:hypothetical protein [Chloroflexota bacterium]